MTAQDLDEQDARRRDADDPLPSRRDEFLVPPWPGGRDPDWAYFAGNSLGLMPRSAREALDAELERWGRLAVEAWFEGDAPWLDAASACRPSTRPARRRGRETRSWR